MAITIIVETGEGSSVSNSYISVAEARQFASDRGVELSSDDEVVAAMLIKSTDYLESQECRYQGRRSSSQQALAWPRTGVYLYCDEVASDFIPKLLKDAQSQLVLAVNQGFDLQPTISPASLS